VIQAKQCVPIAKKQDASPTTQTQNARLIIAQYVELSTSTQKTAKAANTVQVHKRGNMKRPPPTRKKSAPQPQQSMEQFTIFRRKHLMQLLNEATDKQLRELYDQILGKDWKHLVAELGHTIREILIKRKYSS
jgi:hypothetical protein